MSNAKTEKQIAARSYYPLAGTDSGGYAMTLTQLALLYYKEGCRGRPIKASQSKNLFLQDF